MDSLIDKESIGRKFDELELRVKILEDKISQFEKEEEQKLAQINH